MRQTKLLLAALIVAFLFLWGTALSQAAFTAQEAHEKYIYPVVRVTIGYVGGSGTIIYSYLKDQCRGSNVFTDEDKEDGKSPYYSTYVLTNYHVVDSAISITEEWDTDLQKNIKKEKRSIVYVEIFKYRNISTPIGTLKVEADVVLYDKDEDVALLKLRTEECASHVANLVERGKADAILVMDESIAVGCSLGFPPLPTVGVITRKNFQIKSLPYHMSSSQIIYGNSGGAMFNAIGQLIGIPARVAIVGWGTPIPHMGLFIPMDRIYDWLEEEHYDFIFDATKNEADCLEVREEEIEAKKEAMK